MNLAVLEEENDKLTLKVSTNGFRIEWLKFEHQELSSARDSFHIHLPMLEMFIVTFTMSLTFITSANYTFGT